MASRNFDWFQTLGKKRVDITGSFQPNGTTTAMSNVYGNGFSVTRTGVGVYTVVLQDPYFGYDSAWCDLECPTLGQMVQLIAEPDVRVAKTIVIGAFTTSSGAAGDLTFNANTRVHFGIRLKNTSGNF